LRQPGPFDLCRELRSGGRRLEDYLAGMSGGADFGGAAVVEDDLCGWGVHDDAGGGVGEAGDVDAGVGGEGSGENIEGDIDSGGAVVMDGDGDEPAGVVTFSGGKDAGFDVDNGEVGKAAVAKDPVGEEPAEILAAGLLKELFEADSLDGGIVGGEGLVAPFGEGLLEGLIAGDIAEHPPDGRSFAAIVELVGGGDEGLADGSRGGVGCLRRIEANFSDVERLHEVVESEDGGRAPLILLDPEKAHELGEAFVEPGLARVNPGVREGVGQSRTGAGGG